MTPTTALSRRSLCLVLALAASIALRADLGALQGRGQGGGRGAGAGGGAPAPAPAPDPIPTSAASIMMNPAAYLGKPVTITASVARQFAPTAFTVDQNRSTAQGEVLVITSMLTEMPAPNAYVTVIGEAIAFDPAEVTKKLKGGTLNLPADIVTAFLGKPAIVATAVVASNMTDLTKRKPDPMSPDDEKLSAIMKQVSPAATALRTAATASDATAAKEKTAELKKLFTDAQAVFQGRNIMTAVIYSSDAIKYVDAADAAVTAGKWPDAVAAAASLTQTCTTCHNAHRARQDDGTYRLKTGGH